MGGKRITEGMGFATDGQREFNRGISFHTASVTLCSICDYASGANDVIGIRGPHQIGIDTSLMTGGPALRLANGSGGIVARNAANTTNFQLVSPDSSNKVNLGFGSAGLTAWQSIGFDADNSYNIGSTAARVANVVSAANISNQYWFNAGGGSLICGVSCSGTFNAATAVFQGGILTHC
jgi:hypothetical protein